MNSPYKPVLVVLLIFMGVGLVSLLPRLSGAREVVPWRADFVSARAESRRVHKPVFVDFTANWCEYCRRMSRTTWSDGSVASALEATVPVRVDVDHDPDLARQYGVMALPAFALIGEDGTAIKFGTRAMSSNEFVAWLKG